MKKCALLLLTVAVTSHVYSMEKQQNAGQIVEVQQILQDNIFYQAINGAIAKYNLNKKTDYTYNDIAHIKRTGLYWKNWDWFLSGYSTGQYIDVHNKIHTGLKNDEYIAHFWRVSPKIIIKKSSGDFNTDKHASLIKIEVDTYNLEQDMFNRMPWINRHPVKFALITSGIAFLPFIATYLVKYYKR